MSYVGALTCEMVRVILQRLRHLRALAPPREMMRIYVATLGGGLA